jgi:signal transduction histidine kinase
MNPRRGRYRPGPGPVLVCGGGRGTVTSLTLRTELSLVLSSLLVLSIGAGGGTAIYQSARSMRRELTTEYQLFAENRAFALRDNLVILEEELKRLALLPEMDPRGQDLVPAEQILASAHEHSVLYNAAVLLISADGRCLRSVPDRPEYRGQTFADRSWFQAARAGSSGPLFRITDEPNLGRTLKIVQPLIRGGEFVGAVAGVITLSENNLITPALRDNLPRDTDAVLVDDSGQVVYPPERARAAEGSDWEQVINAAAAGGSGTLTGRANGQETLFAFSEVRASTKYAVVFAWPWSGLTANLKQQAFTLGGFLLLGVVIASIVGVMLSAYLTRPLQALGDAAIRIARGEPVPSAEMPRAAGTEEVSALVAAFEHMETSIRQRDQELRDAAGYLEQRVRGRTQELVATQQALVEAERFAAMGKTSAAIAHELKNTLNGLGMAVELIAEDPTNKPRLARLRPQVAQEIARLRDVVDSLLSFSRSPRVDRAPADLTAVVNRARDLLGDLIAERGTEVSVDAPPALPAVCDAHKIQGVMVNLVKNAIEAARTVRVRAQLANGEVVLEVADDGPGLSPDARLHLFEPFFSTKPNGTGLGLPTSRRYVEAHGGSIEAGVAPDLGGALFRVRLPRQVPAADGAGLAPGPSPRQARS